MNTSEPSFFINKTANGIEVRFAQHGEAFVKVGTSMEFLVVTFIYKLSCVNYANTRALYKSTPCWGLVNASSVQERVKLTQVILHNTITGIFVIYNKDKYY